MSHRLVLCFPCLVLLLSMNGQGSNARDMKALQEREEKTGAHISSVSHGSNQPYLDGWYKNTQEEGKTTKHSNQPYLDGWYKNTQEQEKSTQKSNQPYLDGWLKNTQEEGQTTKNFNRDGWYKYTQREGKTVKHSNQPYLDGWLKNTKVGKTTKSSSQPYLDGWYKNTPEEGKSTQKSHQPYLDGWLKNTQEEGKTARNSNQSYLDGWYKNTQDGEEKATHNSKQAYLDGWYKNSQDKEESKDSDIVNYKKTGDSMEESKGKPSSKVDHRAAFKALFFTLDDLYVGNVMTLQFPVREYNHFLPRKAADAIPFSTSQFPSLLQLFSITENSPQGQDMKDILEQCEFPPTKGETKACPASLESMLEFVGSILGTDVNYNILTTSYPTASSARLQNYTVLEVSKDIYAPKWVACHPRLYPYGLYYCHYLDIGSKVFKVLLGGQYGEKMYALGICHLDTSDMDPNHILFRQLGMQPGEAPLCHFFPILHLLWVPLPQKATM